MDPNESPKILSSVDDAENLLCEDLVKTHVVTVSPITASDDDQFKPKERYANEYFKIEGDSDRYQIEYSKQLSNSENDINAIEILNIKHIDIDHWLVQLLKNHVPNLQKLCFNGCSFENADEILSQHMNLTHLAFRNGNYERDHVITLPDYRHLISLELSNFHHIKKSSLEQILINNPQLQHLTLRSCGYHFKFRQIMELISNNLNHLKELVLINIIYGSGILDDDEIRLMDKFVGSLESFAISNVRNLTELLTRMSANCKNIKRLELDFFDHYFSTEKTCTFDQVDTLTLSNLKCHETFESIIEFLPNLRWLFQLYNIQNPTSAQILSILRKCKRLERFAIKSNIPFDQNEENGCKFNSNFHNLFIETVGNQQLKIEFHEYGEIIGHITRDEIVWRDKLLHWVGFNPIHSQSTRKLLDLADIGKKINGKHKQPINLIFNYLDLNSLYSFCSANKQCKQLVYSYINKRCQSSSKRRTKLILKHRGKLFITDEFGINSNSLRAFGKCIKYLEIHEMFERRLEPEVINEYCKNIETVCVRSRNGIWFWIRFPHVQHFIYYGKSSSDRYYLSALLDRMQSVEILEIRTPIEFYTTNVLKYKSSGKLKKFRFKPFDQASEDYVREFFKDSHVEVIVDHQQFLLTRN